MSPLCEFGLFFIKKNQIANLITTFDYNLRYTNIVFFRISFKFSFIKFSF